MLKNKVYAVRKGRKVGIFKTWLECKKQIDGFSGQEYKSFTTLEEAENYLNTYDACLSQSTRVEEFPVDIQIYTDGSYSEKFNVYSWAFVAVIEDKIRWKKSGVVDDSAYVGSRNVSGEIVAVLQGVDYAIYKGYKHVEICYDYIGLEKWFNGDWKTKSQISSAYVYILKNKAKKISISFKKIKAHSGNYFNEMADKLAKGEIKNACK